LVRVGACGADPDQCCGHRPEGALAGWHWGLARSRRPRPVTLRLTDLALCVTLVENDSPHFSK